jgi:hypothetical protein
MEESKNQLTKNTMTWGAIIGASVVVVSYILSFLKVADFGMSNFATFLVMVGGLFWSVKKYRDILNGTITFKQALGAGVLTSLFASIIIGFFTYLHLRYFDPALMAKIVELSRQQYSTMGYPEAQVDLVVGFISPFFMFVSQIFAYTFWGTIFSLITAAFMKKAPAVFS